MEELKEIQPLLNLLIRHGWEKDMEGEKARKKARARKLKEEEKKRREEKKQEPIRTLLEERPTLLIGLASFDGVNSSTRKDALTLTLDLLQQGYWSSSTSKKYWGPRFADALIRNIERGFDIDDPRLVQLVADIAAAITRRIDILVPLFDSFRQVLQRQVSASSTKKAESSDVSSGHLPIPMGSTPNDSHDSSELQVPTRSHLCLAALSMWGYIGKATEQGPLLVFSPSLVDAMFEWPSQLSNVPDSYGISLDSLPDEARRGRDLYMSFREAHIRSKQQAAAEFKRTQEASSSVSHDKTERPPSGEGVSISRAECP